MTQKPTAADRTIKVGRFALDLEPNKVRPEMNCRLMYYDIYADQERFVLFGEIEIADLRAMLDFAERRGAKFANADRESLIADWPADEYLDKLIERRERHPGGEGTPCDGESEEQRVYLAKAAAYFQRRLALA